MTIYVMTQTQTADGYSLTGPFPTDVHARIWGEQQMERHSDWRLLDLDDPGAEPLVLAPAVWGIADGRIQNYFPPPAAGEPGNYILYPTDDSYCFIGPFDGWEQLKSYVDIIYDDPRWWGLLLNEPPRAPRVEPAPAIPDELVQQHIAKQSERKALLEKLEALGW